MERPWPWITLVVLLVGILLLREPRFQSKEQYFLRWLLDNSTPRVPRVPLTVVEIGQDKALEAETARNDTTTGAVNVSPLEHALFLQAVLEFRPTVVAFETVLRWRSRDKDQEQVFLDQAMRVPRLLLAAELTATPEPDAPVVEIPIFTQVSGSRAALPQFSGVGRQPDEDLRLIATLGFVNMPEPTSTLVHVPLLFGYRGEVVPSFALQAIMLWLRTTPAEVKVDLGNTPHIMLPQNRRIPIRADGTILIDQNAARGTQRYSLNEFLLAAQQKDKSGLTVAKLENLRDQLVLSRTPSNPTAPPDVFAATIATIQSNRYLRRVSPLLDIFIILGAAALTPFILRMPKIDLLLGVTAFTAAYLLAALGIVARWHIWLPGFLPLTAAWLLVLLRFFTPRRLTRLRQADALSPVTP